LSQCYLALDNDEKSGDEFQNAIKATPTSLQDYIDLAKIFYDRNMTDYVIKIINEGIKAYPDNEALYIMLSNIYDKAGDTKTAKKTLEDLIKIKPTAMMNAAVKYKMNSYGG
jgi:tetratricopeptide (TPR) repeat protein